MFMQKGHRIDYNISHDGYWVILGSTDDPQLRIGVDTVTLDRPQHSIDSFIRGFEFQVKKIKTYLNENEIGLIVQLTLLIILVIEK